MTLNDYQQLAARTINKDLIPAEMESHALYGLAAEVGELHGIYQKGYQGHTFDLDHAMKEAGDCMWMLAEWCTANGVTLEAVCQMNIDKLRARYPDGFDAEHSLHRREGDI